MSDLVATVRGVAVRQMLPEGLARLAPGPELGVLLAGLDRGALAGGDLVEVLRARARQLAHDQAQFLAVLREVGLADPSAGPEEVARLTRAPEFAADEIRAALAWTRNAADREFHFAEALLGRLPRVFAALDEGVICRSKAWLFAELCAELTDEQAGVVCDRLLPEASRLTTGELAARIKKLAIALDPEWAARRYAQAVRDRDVIGYLDEDGTATVTGRRLPADQAAAACARIEELAKAAKRAGYPGRIGPLRADIYVGLLDGRWAHHTRDQIIADLLAHATPDSAPDSAPAGSASAAGDTPDTGDTPTAGHEGGSAGTRTPQPRVGVERVGVELRVGLSTLLGRDRHPGEVPGWGPVTAETARTIATAQRTAEWRYAVTDADGRLLLAGITRHRPTLPADPTPPDGPAAGTRPQGAAAGTRPPGAAVPPAPGRGGIVELHLPAALLTELAADPGAGEGWTAVIADIAAQYAAHRDRQTPGPGSGGNRQAGPAQDPDARFAGTALRRHVQIRDRVCVYPGCRCPARHADLDHTVDHARGGGTTEANSGPVCRHDHRLKHEGGWRLSQPEPGHFTWTSPLGRIYRTRPQPITVDLPDPRPRPEPYPEYAPPGTADEEGPILWRPPPKPDPPPRSPPPDPDAPPPF